MKRKAHGQRLAARSGRRPRSPRLPRVGRRGAPHADPIRAAAGLPHGLNRPFRPVASTAAGGRPSSVSIACERASGSPAMPIAFRRGPLLRPRPIWNGTAPGPATSDTPNGQVNAWINRAASDLHMMTTELPTGPYPYAGVPWFNTPFGRDGIITALECLWLRPGLARGVLAYLAATQATEVIPEEDAEPGQNPPRNPQRRDGRAQGDALRPLLRQRRCHAVVRCSCRRVLRADRRPGVRGIALAQRRGGTSAGSTATAIWTATASSSTSGGPSHGLLHQGWKDSDDAIFHADGSPAQGPIALCEVQGYVYAARKAGAVLAAVLGRVERAAELAQQAQELQERFEQAFWCEDLSSYALALDGEKRPCRVRASNAGHCLFTGIAGPERAERVAETLLGPDSFSGWGVRTVAASESRYNPMSYHTGSVWPHDNALIAHGLSRYGLTEKSLQIWNGLFAAGMYFELQRMPELFCGFSQDAGEGPVLYPVACAPQAWSAASVFLLLQACLGLEISAPQTRISFIRPTIALLAGRTANSQPGTGRGRGRSVAPPSHGRRGRQRAAARRGCSDCRHEVAAGKARGRHSIPYGKCWPQTRADINRSKAFLTGRIAQYAISSCECDAFAYR